MKKLIFHLCRYTAYIFVFFFGRSILEDKDVLRQEKKMREIMDALKRK